MNARPEMIADVEPDGGSDDGAERNEMGLTADEQAAFDGMKDGGTPDTSDAGDSGENEGDGGTDDGAEQEQNGEKTPENAEAKPGAERQTPKNISYGKYKREIDKAKKDREDAIAERQAALTEAQNYRVNQAKLEERLTIINQAIAASQQAQQPQGEQPVNPLEEPDIDPREDYAAAIEQNNRRNKFIYEMQTQSSQQMQERQADIQLKDDFMRDAQSFESQEPSFRQAYAYLKDSRLIELAISQFDKDPRDPNTTFTRAETDALIHNFNREEKFVVQQALEQRKSPSAALYKLARIRGFNPAPPEQANTAPKPAPAPKAAPQTAPKPPAAPNVVQELESLRQARDGGLSLSDGGGSPGNALTPEALLRMGDEEFSDFIDMLPKHKMDELMGK